MERILRYSREQVLGWSPTSRKGLFRDVFFELFPFFIYPDFSDQMDHNYENRDDYLFLSEIHSSKDFIRFETISFII